ncbi:MAG TPA: hypothetical protein PKD98_23015 [Anaerolineae bacterium]|nr:hypothetical protein [Anaerolineae bacterium]
MAGILSALGRGKPQTDPMRASAALTTVYLLEQNQKFEQFMRRKVEELEARVAAQQARLSSREQAEERELWAALTSFEAPPVPLVAAAEVSSEPNFAREDEPEGWDGVSPVETASIPAGEETWESVAPVESAFGPDSEPEGWDGGSVVETPPPAEVPDYLALMLGSPAVPVEADSERLADDALDSDVPNLDDSNWDPSLDEDMSEDEPADDLASTLGEELNDPEASMVESEQEDTDQAVPMASPAEATEVPTNDFEGEAWASRTYEAFQVRLPEAEAVEHLWAAVGVERFDAEPPARVGQSRPAADEPLPPQAEAETEEAWEATLPGGRKGDWT